MKEQQIADGSAGDHAALSVATGASRAVLDRALRVWAPAVILRRRRLLAVSDRGWCAQFSPRVSG